MKKNLIPTINISSLVKDGYHCNKSIKTINKIKEACINIGNFQVTGHGTVSNTHLTLPTLYSE